MLNKLDKIDLQILDELQRDGRITNIELSKRVGISAPPCLRRVKTLESYGLISSYHANLNMQALGFSVTVFAEVGLHNQNEQELKKFEEQISQWAIVRECYLVTGGFDYLLKIVAKSFESYQEFISQSLGILDNVNQIKTRMVMRPSKKEHGVSMDLIAC